MIPIRLIGPKVLVALEPKATTREDSTGMHYHDKGRSENGTIILAQPTDQYDADDHSRGLVVAVGTKKGVVELATVQATVRQADDFGDLLRRLEKAAPAPFEVAVHDVVLFSPATGISLGEQADGIVYVILAEKDIYAVISPKAEAA